VKQDFKESRAMKILSAINSALNDDKKLKNIFICALAGSVLLFFIIIYNFEYFSYENRMMSLFVLFLLTFIIMISKFALSTTKHTPPTEKVKIEFETKKSGTN
jgi:hypothetical protein